MKLTIPGTSVLVQSVVTNVLLHICICTYHSVGCYIQYV